jgi:hypothetical protein
MEEIEMKDSDEFLEYAAKADAHLLENAKQAQSITESLLMHAGNINSLMDAMKIPLKIGARFGEPARINAEIKYAEDVAVKFGVAFDLVVSTAKTGFYKCNGPLHEDVFSFEKTKELCNFFNDAVLYALPVAERVRIAATAEGIESPLAKFQPE